MYNVDNCINMFLRLMGSRIWTVLFLVACVYLFFRANRAYKRAMIAAAIAFVVGINDFVLRFYYTHDEGSVYYRLLWVIPYMIVIGWAFVDVVRRLPWLLLRLLVVAGFIALLLFSETETPRWRYLLFDANATLLQEDVFELTDALKALEASSDKTLFVGCPNVYGYEQRTLFKELSMYYGGVQLVDSSTFSANGIDGELVLLAQAPEVSYIMSTACEKGLDYVIVYRWDGSEEAFMGQGYQPAGRTGHYLIYACSGYAGYKQDINRFGQTTYISYYDDNGLPRMNSNGYCTVRYSYDGRSIKSCERYYDQEDRPCNINKGYAGIEYAYDANRRCIRQTYLGEDGGRINLSDGYATVLKKYNIKGKVISLSYRDMNDLPVLMNGCYEVRSTYQGQYVTREEYCDSNGLPMLREDTLCASCEFDYNNAGKRIAERYYGLDGTLTITSDGYAALTREYDDAGNPIIVRCYGVHNEPVLSKKGYAEIHRVYSGKKVIHEEYYGLDGQLAPLENGYAAIDRAYDEAGNVAVEKYYDENLNPTVCKTGYAEVRRIYNEKKQIVHEEYYGVNGELMLLGKGFAAQDKAYDEAGNVTVIKYYGTDLKPALHKAGYAEVRRVFNENKQIIHEEYFGTDGKRILLKDGYAAIDREYDADGNVVREEYYGVDLEPVSIG